MDDRTWWLGRVTRMDDLVGPLDMGWLNLGRVGFGPASPFLVALDQRQVVAVDIKTAFVATGVY